MREHCMHSVVRLPHSIARGDFEHPGKCCRERRMECAQFRLKHIQRHGLLACFDRSKCGETAILVQ